MTEDEYNKRLKDVIIETVALLDEGNFEEIRTKLDDVLKLKSEVN